MIQFFQNLFRKIKPVQLTEEEKQAKLLQERAAYQARKEFITDYLDKYYKKQDEIARAEYRSSQEYANKHNSVCPNCGSKEIVHVFRRVKGELDGSSSGGSTHYSSLFSSYNSSHHSGHVHGELDTFRVLKCNTCGNEWEEIEAKNPSRENIFSEYKSSCPGYLVRRIEEYFELEYDPDDLSETTFSLEEKRKKYLDEIRNSFWLRQYRGVPIEVLEYTAATYMRGHYWSYDDEGSSIMNYNEDKLQDDYCYRFPPKVREVVEYLTKED